MRLSMRVWDLGVRLFHGALALALALMVATGLEGAARWHRIVGLGLAGLLVWRVLWGMIGSETARFGAFLVAPRLRPGRGEAGFGHAEAGGVLLLVLLGLIAVAEGAGFAHLAWHGALVWLVGALVLLHLGLVAAAARRGEAPLRAVLIGKVRMDAARRAPRLAGPGLALLVLALAGAAAFALARLSARLPGR